MEKKTHRFWDAALALSIVCFAGAVCFSLFHFLLFAETAARAMGRF